MRSVLRGIGWAGILGGLIGQVWGPDNLTFVPHIVIGVALLFAAGTRANREATDYTSVMLAQAGYADPDATLPAGVRPPTTDKKRGGLGFIVWLIIMALILWPLRGSFADRFDDAFDGTSFSDIFDSDDSGSSWEDSADDGPQYDAGGTPAELTGIFVDDLAEEATEMMIDAAGTSMFTSVHFRPDSVSGYAVHDDPQPTDVAFVDVRPRSDVSGELVSADDLEANTLIGDPDTESASLDASLIDFDLLIESVEESLSQFADRSAQAPTSVLAIVRPSELERPDEPGGLTYYVSIDNSESAYYVFRTETGEIIYEAS